MNEQRLYYIDRETEEIRSTEYYRDRATSSAFFNSEHDALNAVINRIFARMSADGDKLSKHVERRKEIEGK